MPVKTKADPNQWANVNGFLKYNTENNKENNFLKVRTRVTVRDWHSADNL